jgi:hypothetical protein
MVVLVIGERVSNTRYQTFRGQAGGPAERDTTWPAVKLGDSELLITIGH